MTTASAVTGWRSESVTCESLTGCSRPKQACLAWGFDGSMMTCHDDSQRSDGLPVTFAQSGDPHESLTARRAHASVPHLGFDGWS